MAQKVGVQAQVDGKDGFLAAFQQMEGAMKAYSSSLSGLNAAVANVNNAQKQAAQAMSGLHAATTQSSGSITQLKGAHVAAAGAAEQQSASSTKLHGILGLLNSNAVLVAGGLAKIGQAAVGIGVDAVSAFGDFEAQMNVVKATSDLTDDQLKQLTDQAIQLGVKFPVSASDAAAGMGELSKAGFSANEIMSASNGLVTLASAAHLDMAKSATILAGAIRGFGLEAKDAGHVTDLLAQVANASSVDVSDLGETFKYVGPIAKAAGFSIEDMSVAIGLMGNNMIKGSDAGTALRSIITRLEAPPKDAAAAIAQLGLSLKNQDGTAKSFAQIMVDLREKMAGLSKEEQISIGKHIAGQEAISGLLAIVNASPEDYQKMTDAIAGADGAGDKMSKTMMQGVKGSIENLKGSVEALQIKFGQALEPAILAVTNGLADLANAAGPVVEALGSGLTTAFSVISSIVMDRVIPAVRQVYDWMGARIGPIIKSVGDVIRDNIVPAVQSMAAGFERELLPRLRDAWQFISANLGPVFDGFFSFIANTAVPTFGTLFSIVSQHVVPVLAKLADLVGTVLGPPLRLMGQIITQFIWPALEGIGHFVNDVVLPALGFLLEGIGHAIDDLKNFADALMTPVRILSDNLPKGFDTYRQSLKDAVLATDEGKKAWNEAAEAYKETDKAIHNLIGIVTLPQRLEDAMNAMSNFSGAVSGAKAIIDDLASRATVNLHDKINDLATLANGIATTAWQNYSGWADTTTGKLKLLNDQIDELKKRINESSQAMSEASSTMSALDKIVTGRFSPAIQDLWNQWKTYAEKAREGGAMTDQWSTLAEQAKDKAIALDPKIKDLISGYENMSGKLDDSTKKFEDSTVKMANADGKARDLKSSTDKLVGALADAGGAFLNQIGPMDKFQGKMGELPGTANRSMGGVIGAVQNQNFSGALISAGIALVDGLAAGIRQRAVVAAQAAANAAYQAAEAARAALQMKSPSKVFELIGELTQVGMQQGIEKNKDKPVGAAKDAAKEVGDVALNIAKDQADLLQKVSEAGLKITDLMEKLRNYSSVGYSNISRFGQDITAMMQVIQFSAAQFQEEGLKATATFGEAAGKTMSGLASAFSLLKELPDYSSVGYSNISRFGQDVIAMMQEAGYAAAQFQADGLTASAAFGDAAGKTTSGLKNALELFNGLRGYTQIPYQVLQAFIDDVRRAIDLAKGMVMETDKDLLAQVGLFGEATGKLFTGFKAAMDVFESLKKFVPTPSTVIQQFIDQIKYTVTLADGLVKDTDKDLLERVIKFGGAIGNIFNGFKAAMDLFAGLDKYKKSVSTEILKLFDDIEFTIKKFEEKDKRVDYFVELTAKYEEKMRKALEHVREGTHAFALAVHEALDNGEIDAGGGAVASSNPADAVEQQRLQGLAGGGRVTKAGIFRVGEEGPELAFLPAGARILDALTSRRVSPVLQQIMATVHQPAGPGLASSYYNNESYSTTNQYSLTMQTAASPMMVQQSYEIARLMGV